MKTVNTTLRSSLLRSTRILTILVVALGLVVCQASVSEAAPIGTAFTYQGHLYDANHVADGLYDFQFKLYDANTAGSQLGDDVNKPDVDVFDAYFTVELDLGSDVFDGNAVWLEIGVRPGEMNDPNVYTTLSPRQEVTPTPYAIYAKTAGSDNDWMISGDDMYSIPSGNVGIGTTSPGTKLHVYEPSSSDVYMSVEASSTDGEAGVRLRNPAGGWDVFANNDDGDFGIAAHVLSERVLTIKNTTGNVGIGTNSPQNKLDVEGAAAIGTSYSGTETAPSNGMIVEGAVGIGTTSPGSAKLKVSGGVLDVSSNKIVNLAGPTANQDAATKKYVDDNLSAGGLVTWGNTTFAESNIGNTWEDVTGASLSVSVQDNDVVLMMMSCRPSWASDVEGFDFRFMRDSTAITNSEINFETANENNEFPFVRQWAEAPGAGSYTYKVQARATGSGNDVSQGVFTVIVIR